MGAVAGVMSLGLAALFLVLGTVKVARSGPSVAAAEHLGFSVRAYQGIGVLELAGAAGLVGGVVFWSPVGIAAAIGLVALLVGAVVSLRRAGDGMKKMVPAVWLGLVATATAVVSVAAL